MNIAEVQALCLQWNIPFYSYRLPGEKDVCWGAQLGNEVDRFEGMENGGRKDGFIIVPFRETEQVPALFIRNDVSFVNRIEDNQRLADILGKYRQEVQTSFYSLPSVSREEYHYQVTTMIETLKQKVVSKMVLSRSLLVECEAFQNAPVWFEKLARRYPEAFVFLVSVPGVMTWMGATPEIFLQQDGLGIETMALAGTRTCGTEGGWGDKEIEEQQIVSRYIASLLKESGVWNMKGPFSKPAGKVEHLCTSFYHIGHLSLSMIDRLRLALHPTPAVGGFPAQKAVELLERIEGHERRYYAGYLGPVHYNMDFHWFVNLRCMEVFSHAVSLYVGGGITALSDPEKEWEETELKSHTLLDVIT